MQVHDKFKCTHKGKHPLLNAPMWLAPAPITIVSHAARRESGQTINSFLVESRVFKGTYLLLST